MKETVLAVLTKKVFKFKSKEVAVLEVLKYKNF